MAKLAKLFKTGQPWLAQISYIEHLYICVLLYISLYSLHTTVCIFMYTSLYGLVCDSLKMAIQGRNMSTVLI